MEKETVPVDPLTVLYEARKHITEKLTSMNTCYTRYAEVLRRYQDEAKNLDTLIEKHLAARPTT